MVPTNTTPNIQEEAHCQVGHLDVVNTFKMIQRKFNWPGCFKTVEEFCRNFEVFAKNKAVPKPRSPISYLKWLSFLY